MQNIIGDKPLNRDYGKDIDSLVRIRDQAKMDLAKSRMALLEHGVKTFKDDLLNHLPGLDLNIFQAWKNHEFAWEAEYKDGSVVKQFEGKKHNHYGNIDQSQLKKFSWVSCFDYPTDNTIKRVIVSLDFETGKFDFLNGFCPQEIRGILSEGFPEGFIPKLIMKMVLRSSTTLNFPEGGIDEISEYNRYLIGFEGAPESPTQKKQIVCIEPNGLIHLWHEQ